MNKKRDGSVAQGNQTVAFDDKSKNVPEIIQYSQY